MRTNDLRKLIVTKLNSISNLKKAYYEIADDKALYPHAVFTFDSVDLGDLSRKDYILSIDVWADKNVSTATLEDIVDKIEDAFCSKNLPQTDILPTFYLIDRKTVDDPDQNIKHRLIKIQIQLYES